MIYLYRKHRGEAMKYNDTHSKENKNISSSIVSNLINDTNVGAKVTTGITNKYSKKIGTTKDNRKVIICASVAILLVIIILVVVLLLGRKGPKSKDKESTSIFDIAYDTMGFKEDKSLKKLYCSKEVSSEDNKEVIDNDIQIYYFKGDDIQTVIYHNDISLTDNYMDYYDTMYKEYDKSLEQNYNYDNVDTNLTKGTNRMLVTIIIYGDRTGDNVLGLPNFVNYDDAKKASIDDGYTCS